MRIMLANQQLQPVADLLTNMPLKAAQSRARSKLLTLVREAIARFGEDEYDLVTHYASLDESGRPVFADDGTFMLADPDKASEFLDARQNLLTSIAEVSGPTYDGHDKDVKTLLDGYDGELSGEAAEAYDVLYDAITKDNT
ncbi:hypothetical protein CATYP_10505 (plasmid) [Corynebacterium atypicum]|uniref:DUF1617 domain-containing protein n=1 Tax=Corynebacterium atypicum TaxID=191610 RepID=A0ABM5QPS1_9CORY|nr:DUF1617 family protein [Corynebacterium atypicum]AIG64759.1 hypothetical protein CATYP_09575 [Corynebacterium atypicum]AIG64901.1 hypothetical protein CATYP_10505 [Corynebacterium atypicum]